MDSGLIKTTQNSLGQLECRSQYHKNTVGFQILCEFEHKIRLPAEFGEYMLWTDCAFWAA